MLKFIILFFFIFSQNVEAQKANKKDYRIPRDRFHLYKIPEDFKSYDSVKVIALNGEDTNFSALKHLEKFKNLENIYFYHVNNITSEILINRISNSSKVDSVLFYRYQDSIFPKEIIKFKNLKYLLFGTSLITDVPDYILKLKKLQVIVFGAYDNFNLHGGGKPYSELKEFPLVLLKMKSLKRISITGSQIQRIDYRLYNNKKGIKIYFQNE